MRHFAAALALLPVFLCTPSHAGVHWLCGLSEDSTQLVCVADLDLADTAAALREPAATTAVVNGTRFPLDPGRIYTVNFWSPATDLAFVDQLARATICYRSPACQLTFSPKALQRRAAQSAPQPG
jgi:hypothetical protein